MQADGGGAALSMSRKGKEIKVKKIQCEFKKTQGVALREN